MNPQFSQPKGAVSKETNKDSIARKFGCKKSEVLYAKTGAGLTGYKVIYDKVSQRSYALPSDVPAGATVTSLIDGVLVHSAGTVDLGALAVLRDEFVTLVENFTSGFTIRVKNEVVSDGTYLYRWAGSLPKTVNASSTVAGTGGISPSNWVNVGEASIRRKLGEIYSVKDYGAKGDGVTDDTAAIQALLNQLTDDYVTTPAPKNANYTVVFPSGIYKVTSLDVGRRTQLRFDGGRLEPFETSIPRTHLIKFSGGYNKVHNLCVNMDYAMNYDTVIWCRTRYIDFIAPEIWSAKCVWTFGDPAWKNDPVGGILGDSEIQIIGGWCNWCITHHKAYGVNTIVQFVGHECYSYKWSLPSDDPRKTAWEALPEITGYNSGALIYLTGSFTGNYSGQQPNFLSQLQVTSTADYKNTYGRYVLSGTHVETGLLFQCDAAPSGVVAQDDYTQMLNLVNCTGYVSGGRTGYFINGLDSLQHISVINCNFYGNAVDKLVYALNSKVHVSRDSFPSVTGGNVFNGIQARHFFNYEVFNPFNVVTSAQALSNTLTPLKMTGLAPADLDAAFTAAYYDSSTGNFTIQQNMLNVEVEIALFPTSGASTDSTDLVLMINGVQSGVINCVGSTPNAKFKIKSLTAGAVVQVQAASYSSRTLNGSANNRISITGSC